jgi:hypothetical protein
MACHRARWKVRPRRLSQADWLLYAALSTVDLVPVQEVEIHNCASNLPIKQKPRNRAQRRAEAARKRRNG